MGYYKEKREYEEEKEGKEICNDCGGIGSIQAKCCGNTKSFFGKIECENVMCKDCAIKCKSCKKYFCRGHINNHDCNEFMEEDDEEYFDCDFCDKKFTLTKLEDNVLNKKGKIKVRCPWCKKMVTCEE